MGRSSLGSGTSAALAIAAVVAVVSAASAQAAAAPSAKPEGSKRIALEYRRDPHAAVRAEAAVPVSVPEVPDELKVSPPVAASKTPGRRRAIPKGTPVDPEGLGADVGATLALEAAREWGWRQYWRAGFQGGMRNALDDPRPGRWNSTEGYRYGSLDPRALSLGHEIAADAARDAAGSTASEAVRAMFTDLTREPRNGAAPSRRSGEPARWLPAGPWAEPPVFDEVFVAIPFAATPGLDREGRGALEGWRVQPAALARDARSSRAYDPAWKDAGHAFQVWRDRQRPGSYWSRVSPGDRERFRTAFISSFDDTMGDLDLRPTYAGFRAGYAEGWRYGIAVNAEWSYRQGYAAGFDNAVRTTAVLAYPVMFDRAYAYAYDEEFKRWAGNAVPALDGLRLTDGNDDGVIEPGEDIALEGDVVNYGGAPGTFEVRVDGTVLESSAAAAVRLPARSRTPLAPLALRVAPGVAPRTSAVVAVAVADDRRSVAVYVSRPLEIEGDAVVDAEPLRGRVRLVLTVANRSRVPLSAEATLSSLDARTEADRTDALRVPAGGSVRTEAAYEGLRPLDVLGGAPRWKATVRHAGVDDDSRVITIAPASTNLADPDLLTYMIDLARSPQPSRRDVADARALLLDRMRADWDRACAVDGNPYKRDYEVGSAETALGELVRAVDAEHGSFASRAVFAGVGSDIAALAETLPGTHPLLRKWMKRLARRAP